MVFRSAPAEPASRLRRRIAFPGAIALFLAPASPPAQAQQTIEQSASGPAEALPAISVSATGVPTPVTEIASSVTVITASDLEREQRRTLPNALQKVPGLNVVQLGGPGGQTSVFIRGTNSNHVKVLIDGIDVSDPSNPNRSFDFGQLLTEDVARVEVLRGPQSGLYGADAIGGVISVTTKKGEGPPRAVLRTEGGSYGTFNQFGTISGSTDSFNYLFAVSHFRSETTPVTPPELVPPGRRINPNFYDNKTFTTKLGYDFNEVFGVNYVGRVIASELLSTGDIGFPSTPDGFRSSTDNVYAFQRGEAVVSLLDGRFRNVFGIGHTHEYSTSQEPPTLAGPALATRNIGERVKFDYRGDLVLTESHRLLFGAEREDESLNNKSLRPNPTSGNTAGFLQLQSDYAKRLFLVANVRYDENDAFGGAFTYRVAPTAIVPGTETKLKASVGTGFKAPTLSQLFVSFPAFSFFANPNLRPEESFGWDVGFEQPLADDRVRVGATYFDNDLRNLIQTAQVGPISTNVNVGRASAYGVEAFVGFVFSDALQAQVTYTNTSTKDEIRQQELLRRPRHKVATTVDWTPIDHLTISATAIVIGPQVDGDRSFTISRLRTDPYAVVNVAANYQATDHLNVFARVDNLFDRRYEDPTGFLRPGLSAYAGIRITN